MGALASRITDLDRRWLIGLARRRAPRWLDRALRTLTHLGGATVTLGCGLVLLPPLESRLLGWAILVANGSSHGVVQLVKRAVLRQRPDFPDDGVTALVPHPDAFSLPSGHAAAAAAVAATLLLWPGQSIPDPLKVVAVLFAVVVACSRVYLRVHYVTDVLVGQAIGVLGATMAVAILG